MKILKSDQIIKKTVNLKGNWHHKSNSLVIDLKFKNFKETIKVVNKIAKEAEKLNHHPEIKIYSYNNLKITITTHEAGGITENDFKLASKIDKLI